MEINELLWFIFFDEFVGALLVPLKEKYVLAISIDLSSKLNIYTAFLYGFFGAILGAIVNYGFASLCRMGLDLKIQIDKRIELTLLFALLFLPVSYFGGVISFLAGLAKLNFRKFILASVLVLVCYFIFNLVLYKMSNLLFLL